MSYFDISGATFDENLRKLETSDPAHADVFNALLGQLINNDVALKEAVTKFAASKNEQALFLLNLHKDGKKYGVHFDNYDVTPSSNGTRLFDAVGMTAAPSTNAVRAVNDFDGKGCFAYLEVNGSVDENGDFQVQYIKDIDNEFSRTKYDTWCLYLTQYVYRKFDSNGEDTVISDTRHSAEWLPEGGAIRPDGTIRPFVAIAKYMSGDNADGVASSISGVSPKNYSFQSSLTKFRAKGTQYCAETSQDSERMTRLMEIAFATRHSQSVMAGCNWWWTQATATVQENNAERIIISKSAAKEFVVGGTVSIGNANSLTSEGKANNDRGLSGLHAKANKVKITKIEDYDSNNAAVYVDNGGQKFSTAPTSVSGVTCETIISTMPWNTGGCDEVLGSCGSPVSNTSGKEPYILFGVEMSSGFWEPKGNTVMKIENHVMRPYICYDCTKMTTAGATTDDWIALGYAIPDNKGSWKYISKLGYSADDPEVRYPVEVAATSSTGYADGLYTENLETTGDSQREVLGSGNLGNGSVGGRRRAGLDNGLSNSGWGCAARLSACGRCGRKAAA
ncbi:hypothetical protein [Blautia obeum]|uniref:hypothetical protein n=1 Tax=Blautia obeum TaxID=40520 RepID=UPI00319EAEBA